MRNLFLFLFMCIAFGVVAQTKIYKIINEDGTVSFSDTPAPGAQEIELGSNMTTMQGMKPSQPARSNIKKSDETSYSLSITSPAAEATVRDNNGKVRIAANIQPKTPGTYKLKFSGQEYTSKSGVFNLDGIERGAHTYSITFSNNRGKIIASSEERTVYLHQASVLIRSNIN